MSSSGETGMIPPYYLLVCNIVKKVPIATSRPISAQVDITTGP